MKFLVGKKGPELFMPFTSKFRFCDPATDREADVAAILAGLGPLPQTPARRRARLLHRLRLACLSAGRAVAVFALCFAASTLALRLNSLPAPTPSAALPSGAPTAKTGPGVAGADRS